MTHDKPIRVRIESNDEIGHRARVTCIDTGKEINHVQWATVCIDPNKVITAIIEVRNPVVDIIAEADIRVVCPCCGREMQEKTEDE